MTKPTRKNQIETLKPIREALKGHFKSKGDWIEGILHITIEDDVMFFYDGTFKFDGHSVDSANDVIANIFNYFNKEVPELTPENAVAKRLAKEAFEENATTSKIEEINKDVLKLLREKMEKALLEVTKETGVEFKQGNISYNPEGFTMKLEGTVEGGNTKEQRDLETAMVMYGIDKKEGFDNELGKITLVGYKSRSTKYPFIVRTIDGKRYKISKRTALVAFEK